MLPLLWVRRPVALAAGFVSALVLFPLIGMLSSPVSGAGQFASRWQGNESLFAVARWASRQLFEEPAAGWAARIGVACVLLAGIAWTVRRRVPPLLATRGLIWAVLLLSPQVHPWYLAWLLPLELAVGARAGWVWSVAALLAYLPLDRWVDEGIWYMPAGLRLAEYLVVLMALGADTLRAGRAPDFAPDVQTLR